MELMENVKPKNVKDEVNVLSEVESKAVNATATFEAVKAVK